MLPEAGAFELIFLAAVALIVVGPKDLPVLLRKLGQFIARMRGMAAEFRASFDEMARQSELDELRKEVEALRNARFGEPIAADLNAHLGAVHESVIAAMQPEPAPQPAPDATSPDATAAAPATSPAVEPTPGAQA
jgi:sec-independent protein translocase protein TatB